MIINDDTKVEFTLVKSAEEFAWINSLAKHDAPLCSVCGNNLYNEIVAYFVSGEADDIEYLYACEGCCDAPRPDGIDFWLRQHIQELEHKIETLRALIGRVTLPVASEKDLDRIHKCEPHKEGV